LITAGLAALTLPKLSLASDDLVTALRALEAAQGGRLGVGVWVNGAPQTSWRGDERFLMCSTVKLPLVAFTLSRVDAGLEMLDRKIKVLRGDIVAHSPLTQKRVGRTMTVAELCHATLTTSDNAACNLLLAQCGGPEALTAFFRSQDDPVSRNDRWEPTLNAHDGPADLRDTTSPNAMARDAGRWAHYDALRAGSREQLCSWLRGATTGLQRLRSTWPETWLAGDKTGTGADGPTNDVAVAWLPSGDKLVVAAYYDRQARTMQENATVLAEVGRLVLGATGAQ
jgi:beta-lactamase class A